MDAVDQAIRVGELVSRAGERKYYRFRGAPFYGGIATADCVGCNLTCIFCWSWNIVTRAEEKGSFYSPKSVAEKLKAIARRKGYRQVRISGNEPTLNRDHLLGVLETLPTKYRFILETNGILLGDDPAYCRDLSRFANLHVRVSFKGCCPADFQRLTGTAAHGFNLQLRSLENLSREGVNCHAAVMADFSTKESFANFCRRLAEIDPSFRFPEIEELLRYPAVEERLKRLFRR